MARPAGSPPTIKGFTFIRQLGSGGFSDVYLYEQELPRRQVAVKVLLTDELTTANRAAFVAEANVMAQLSTHPYIVSIFHADVSDDSRPFFVMEYYKGPSLADRYKSQPLSVADAVRVGVQVSSAVATGHAANILHRDIKPANVLTNEYGRPGLTDFGISSTVDDDAPLMTVTSAGRAGTLATTVSQSAGLSIPWSPPEMFDDEPSPDFRSDVFSLAATVHTLLAGRTPFEVAGGKNSSLDLMGRIERGAITPIDRDDIPGSLTSVLGKGMAVEPANRYATAVDFARALQRVELELGYAPTAIDVPNLVVPAAELSRDTASEDATRARGITTVNAQPAPAPQPVPTPAPSGVPVAEATAAGSATATATPAPIEGTVLRPPRQGQLDTAAPVAAPPKKRGRAAVVVTLVALTLVVAVTAIVFSNVSSPSDEATLPPVASVGDDDAVVGTAVPAPVLAAATRSADGSQVTFTWTNPTPVEGDSYVWEQVDGLSDERVRTSDPSAIVTGVGQNTTVCVKVYVLRSGELSPDPLEICEPS